MRKYDDLEIKPRYLRMWTLGTNFREANYDPLTDIKPRPYGKLYNAWRLFRMRTFTLGKRKGNFRLHPLFYAFETGKNGYQHIHQLVTDRHYYPFKIARKLWSYYTGIKEPNFGFTKPYHAKFDVNNAVRYAIKYTTKESSRYHWMGEFHGSYGKKGIRKSKPGSNEKVEKRCSHCQSHIEWSFMKNELAVWENFGVDPKEDYASVHPRVTYNQDVLHPLQFNQNYDHL